MRKILIFVFVLPCSLPAYTRDPAEGRTVHRIGYEPGYVGLKEENLIPGVHTGMVHCLTYGFERKQRNFRSFQFLFAYSNPKTSIERKSPDFNDYRKNHGQIHFNYSFLAGIMEKEDCRFYLGPMLSYTYSLSHYYGWDSHAYWGNYLSVGPKILFLYDFPDKGNWLAFLDASLLGFFNRTDAIRLYKVEDWSFFHILEMTNSAYRPGIFTRAFQARFGTEYRFEGSGNRHLAVHYGFYYSRLHGRNSNPLQELIHRTGVSIFF